MGGSSSISATLRSRSREQQRGPHSGQNCRQCTSGHSRCLKEEMCRGICLNWFMNTDWVWLDMKVRWWESHWQGGSTERNVATPLWIAPLWGCLCHVLMLTKEQSPVVFTIRWMKWLILWVLVHLFPQSSCLTSGLMNRGHGGGDRDYVWAQHHGLTFIKANLVAVTVDHPTCQKQRPTGSPWFGTSPWRGPDLHLVASWLIEPLPSWKKQCFVLSERETSLGVDLLFLSTVLLPKPAYLDLLDAYWPSW